MSFATNLMLRLPRRFPPRPSNYATFIKFMNLVFHLSAWFVGTVAPSFCPYSYGVMRHREAPAEHFEHLHLVSFQAAATFL